MRALAGLVSQHGERSARRALATLASAAQKSPFLRFSSPEPLVVDHTPLLATLPGTEVRLTPRSAPREVAHRQGMCTPT